LALDRRPHRAELALERRAALALLRGDRALDARGLALGGAHELLGAALRAQQRALGLGRARGPDLLGLEARAVEELGDLVLGARAHLARGELRAGHDVGRLRVRLGEDVRRLLLRRAQELLDARAEARVGRAVRLAELALGVGELARELHGAGVGGLDARPRVLHRLLQLRELCLDLDAVVAAHRDGEERALVGHVDDLRCWFVAASTAGRRLPSWGRRARRTCHGPAVLRPGYGGLAGLGT